MRFTASTVRRAGEWAREVTSGEVWFGWHGGDLGNGARYGDGRQMLVWLGKHGAREAAAYYLAAGAWWQEQKRGDVPQWAREELAYLASAAQPRSVRASVKRGRADAQSYWDVAQGENGQ